MGEYRAISSPLLGNGCYNRWWKLLETVFSVRSVPMLYMESGKSYDYKDYDRKGSVAKKKSSGRGPQELHVVFKIPYV
jgi:hypothetical protein